MPETTKKPTLRDTAGSAHGPTFDREDFAEELASAVNNRNLGTTVWFENERVQVWDLSLQPGERVPFHVHDHDYFWTVTDAGRLLQRYDDGTSREVEVSVGQTNFLVYGEGERTVHDLENVGDTFFRCVTVLLKS